MDGRAGERDGLYAQASAAHAPAIARLTRAVEADPHQARDLEQEIHLALWRSFARFDGRCAVSTWVYRIAHNVAAGHVARGARGVRLVGLDAAESLLANDDPEARAGEAQLLDRIHALIRRLEPSDAQIILLYLEGVDTAEVTGLQPGTVSVKIHRIKALLARRFHLEERS